MLVRSARSGRGWGSGLAGVIIFSASLPATRVAVSDLGPLFLTTARATIAAVLSTILLWTLGQRRPERGDLFSIAVVSLGVVIGFPLLTALALQHISAARSIVFVGLLPLATALFSLLDKDDRPRPLFWLFSSAGSLIVVLFAISFGSASSVIGDSTMLAAIAICGLGYAKGAVLSRKLGGWQVISWALVLALPVMFPIAFATFPVDLTMVSTRAWLGLSYVSVFSMLIGFVFWYRGLALGGVAAVGQLQLLQPFFGLALAGLVLGERVHWSLFLVTFVVVLCVAGAKRFA